MSKCKRLRAGTYEVSRNGRTFRVEEVGISEGYKKAQWNISEVVGGVAQPPFDAADTLAGARRAIYRWGSVIGYR
jgi:hypothetical protein